MTLTSISSHPAGLRIIKLTVLRLFGVAIVLMLLAIMVLLASLPLADAFGITLGHIDGGSMEPNLWPGDVVVVQRVDARSVRVGDIVSYRRGGQLILHRIVDRRFQPDGSLVFSTKGDANPAQDNVVQAADIRGRLVLAVPIAGGIWMQSLAH